MERRDDHAIDRFNPIDIHSKASEESGIVRQGQEVQGIARTMGVMITPKLRWEGLSWIRQTTSLPLVVKGIQCVEDAVIAYQHGVQGIVLSNHGDESQDTSQAPLLTLLEIRKYAPSLIENKMQIYLDGGIRQGTDVIKAIALGATAVGLGRPFLYSLSAGYSEDGVLRMIHILREKITKNMAPVGAVTLNELHPDLLNTAKIERELTGAVKL
ncbi:hypothetical protein FE257_001485 [Aspergillus nanangensis]|uniref:FMN hydroxy acid dehydrogenase domain-containing protein n=1 Tax=Aspergillus nanangensis TaxID=2582783 RepID=A0AAD4CDN5_ASPNN|nr:hypothetical protein FE257_001485 [Aspergillus nanangensis]